MVRRLLFPGLPAAVLVVVALAAAWWFLIREDNELADAAPEIPMDLQSTPTATGAPATDGEGDTGDSEFTTFTVLTDRSEASYFADEKLARLSLPSTAKGTTREVSGEFHLGPSGLDPSRDSTFVVGLASLTSDEGMRDRRVREALQVSQFPNATFTATSLAGPLDALNPDTDTDLQLTGILEIKGVHREVTWDVKARRDGSVITALATLNFRYEEFEVPLLNIGGFVTVEEDVTLQVQMTAQAS